MKYLVASDIHGSLYYTNKLLERISEEKPDKIILLGDLYYHGPRNPLPFGYEPMEVAKVLNQMKDKLIVLRGNCDAVVDEWISEFQFYDYYDIEINKLKFRFTHGHIQNKDKFPENIDVLVYGHFHTGFIEKVNNKLCINAGSITLPKNNTSRSYLVIDETVKLYNLDGSLIEEQKIGE